MPTDSRLDRHDIELRDIADADDSRCPDDMDGCLVVSYNADTVHNDTYTEIRIVSSRLPTECLSLFDDGTIDVRDLTDEEREWVRAESAAVSNEIDFAGTECSA